jgi:Pre-mRNA 3'-end-processing endonuclease polyadenylation factor C-term
MPPNQVEVNLKFKRVLSAKVMGKLAENTPQKGDSVRGVMVTHNFQSKIVSPEDIAAFTPLRSGSIASKIHVPFAGSVETLKLFLCEMFKGIQDQVHSDGDTVETVLTLHGGMVSGLRWNASLCTNLLVIGLTVAGPEAWYCYCRMGCQSCQ